MYDPHGTPPGVEDDERVAQVSRMVDNAALGFLTVLAASLAESFLVSALAPVGLFARTIVYTAAAVVPVCAAALLVIFGRRSLDAYRRSTP